MGAVSGAVNEGASMVTGTVSGAMGAVSGAVNEGASMVTGTVSGAMGAVSGAVNEGASAVTGTVSGAMGAVSSGIQVPLHPPSLFSPTHRLTAGRSSVQGGVAAIAGDNDDREETVVSPAAPTPAPVAAAALQLEGQPAPRAAPVQHTPLDGARSDVIEIHVDANEIFKVASDVEHYPDWAGDGIQSVTLRHQEPGYVEAVYKAGAFGYMFDFALGFTMQEARRIHFQMLESSVIKKLEGAYVFEPIDAATSRVSFEVVAELGAFVPRFVQNAISKLVVDIALGELRKYVESPRCKENLQARGLL